jgi:hypothetical protein
MAKAANASSAVTRVVVGSYGIFAAGALLAFGVYKTARNPLIEPIATGPFALLLGTVVLGVGCAAVVSGSRRVASAQKRILALAVSAVIVSLILSLFLSEALLRSIARTDEAGTRIGAVTLSPTWQEQVARNSSIIAAATPSGTWNEPFFVKDESLGWTVGANRRSKDGLYASSVEGLRAERPGSVLSDRYPRYRIAIVGDSNAFSLEVPFEESWAHLLEARLGGDFQVLNFGVDGYGLDQILLRTQRDVIAWQPNVVLVGFIQHDLYRSMAVYSFLSFPSWGFPFAKPRFVLADGRLKRVNPDLISPEAIVRTERIDDLPDIGLDLGYDASDWAWRYEWLPSVARFAMSVSPRYPPPSEALSESSTIALNAQLLIELDRTIRESGGASIFAYLPTWHADDRVARAAMEAAGIAFHDMRPCLESVPEDARRVPSGSHYTGTANAALAACSSVLIRQGLQRTND